MQAFQYLKNRGLIYQTSQFVEEALKSILPNQSIYLGVDPTAKGLHIGHLMACRILKRFHDTGVKCIALVGGATALIGDPSFKAKERDILSEEDVQANAKEIQEDLKRVLNCNGDENLLFVNNYEWYKNMGVIDFLRDVGKNMRVQSMLAKDSVNMRIHSKNSLSFAEFSYQCLQANDFLHLHKQFGCICQVGGSDQWGNITSGIDFVKRKTGDVVHGITVPLLTNSKGQKFGKSEGNAIWINKSRTSNHDFYQFFLRTEDADLPILFRLLTDIPMEKIEELLTEHQKCPEKREAQTILAEDLMRSVRSEMDLQKAKKCAELLYGGKESIDPSSLSDVLDELPLYEVHRSEITGKSIADLLVLLHFSQSRKAAKRLILAKGVYLDNSLVTEDFRLNNELINTSLVSIRVGKKECKLLKINH